MWAESVVVEGSQEVIAAKCCPGHSLEAKKGKEELEKKQSTSQYLRLFKYQLKTVYKCHISGKQALVIHF